MAKNVEQKWFALEITVDSQASEAVEFALNELDSIGTEIDSLGKRDVATIEVVGYFNEKPADEIVEKHLTEALRIYGFEKDLVKKNEWREVENRDWLREWKKHWKPTITEKFIIAPPWEDVQDTEKIVIKIEPNMAFGTGTHETTRLCLAAIEENYAPEMSFFDLGTGTGILSIAAAKMKSQVSSLKSQVPSSKSQVQNRTFKDNLDLKNETALDFELETWNSISACDTDEDSVKIAAENAELNGAREINFYVGSISEETPEFNFVCANVTADVIVPLLPLLVRKATKVLVLSGILVEQENLVTRELHRLKIRDFTIKTDGEWIGLIAKIE